MNGDSTDTNGNGSERDRLLTAAQVAERLGTTERYVWSLGRRGILARVVLPGGRLVRFAQSDVDQMIEAARTNEPTRSQEAKANVKQRAASAQISMRF